MSNNRSYYDVGEWEDHEPRPSEPDLWTDGPYRKDTGLVDTRGRTIYKYEYPQDQIGFIRY